ncbi:hypothetical protein C7C46_12390 [Streptomyces tateyamensis]|uniref:Uncharacterized protein n=1 Tax=Streptomyces tateyamensis TaxID=565073 RepID=A0A2V4NJ38_9ACTN|nr:hypothetical protein [Streptomyces tateyamensis]PYC80495.1 hypothetical protein C7C46_12390 [Streptomyces tateyamensis]
MGEWETGQQPWVRQRVKRASQALPCYFCGSNTAMLSDHDDDRDTGRVELYCDNQDCDAREVVILVLRDGAGAHDRADVQALHAVDAGSPTIGLLPTDRASQP